jgi:hypothetical protein
MATTKKAPAKKATVKSTKKATAKKAPAKKAPAKKAPAKKAATKSTKTTSTNKPATTTGSTLTAKTAAAVEPPVNRDPMQLLPEFRLKLEAVLAKLAGEGTPFKFNEGFRTADRQQWLYGSGRPTVKPYGRGGAIVTQRDGVTKLSNHQGNGQAGTGQAADCYPARPDGKIIWPPPPDSDPRWKRYADLARENGLDAGYYWTTFKDLPHIELP